MDTLFSFRYMRVLVATLLVAIILAVAASAAQALEWTFFDDNYATINVEGSAEVVVVPDIATFNFSVEAEAEDATAAQEQSANAINDIMTYFEEQGIAETDIKTTGYNVFERYTWTECTPFVPCNRERIADGYTATQQITVKVRETDNAGALIGGVGERGATNVSGLQFTVDDRDALEEEARLMAIADAKEKAKRRAKELDARLGDVLNVNDGSGGFYPEPMMARMEMETAEFSMDSAAVAPKIAVGENTIRANVTITYELK